MVKLLLNRHSVIVLSFFLGFMIELWPEPLTLKPGYVDGFGDRESGDHLSAQQEQQLWARLNIFGFADNVFELQGIKFCAKRGDCVNFREQFPISAEAVSHMILRIRAIHINDYASFPAYFPVKTIAQLQDCLDSLEELFCDMGELYSIMETEPEKVPEIFGRLFQLSRDLYEKLDPVVKNFTASQQYKAYKSVIHASFASSVPEETANDREESRERLKSSKQEDDDRFCNGALRDLIQESVKSGVGNVMLNSGMVVDPQSVDLPHNSNGYSRSGMLLQLLREQRSREKALAGLSSEPVLVAHHIPANTLAGTADTPSQSQSA